MRRLLLAVSVLAITPAPWAAGEAAAQGLALPDFDVSLLSGGKDESGRYLAAIEIELPEGWKTYWRNPGDSGIPPSFDWSGSENVADIEVVWPAPKLFDDGYGWVIGYKDRLVLPVRVNPKDPADAVRLDLDLSYAVCREICVPEQAKLEGMVGEGGTHAAVQQALRAAPQPIDSADPYGVLGAKVETRGDERVLVVEARFPEGSGEVHLLVEGRPDWYLPVPEEVGSAAGGVRTFEVPLPGNADAGDATFLATGLSPAFSFEQPFRLD